MDSTGKFVGALLIAVIGLAVLSLAGLDVPNEAILLLGGALGGAYIAWYLTD